MVGKTSDRMDVVYSVATKKEKLLIDGIRSIKKEDLIYCSITELASQLNVAEATIVRFCKKLGYNGFQDYKLNVSKELGNVVADSECVVHRIASRIIDAINETEKGLDYEKFLSIADLIIHAQKVTAFGVGNSYIPTVEIANIFARIGINVSYTSDPHLQAIIASNMKENDVAILISMSGSTKDAISIAEICKRNGTKTVVITCYDRSPLAKYGDYLLNSTKREAAYEGGSITSVISISYMIDVLYCALYEKLGPEANDRALRAADSVVDKSL